MRREPRNQKLEGDGASECPLREGEIVTELLDKPVPPLEERLPSAVSSAFRADVVGVDQHNLVLTA
jgi:hypothetical protein